MLLVTGCVLATTSGKKSRRAAKPKWKYIVIHHSATKRGNSSIFDKYHRQRGMQNGMAYHFVICNGSSRRRDGQLEIGNRWKKQLSGGHCRQNKVNNQAIGVCLVGDFTKTRPTRKQLRTLAKLINELRKKYDIPLDNVIGHGKIKGEKTKCPGRKFPWWTLKKEIKATQ